MISKRLINNVKLYKNKTFSLDFYTNINYSTNSDESTRAKKKKMYPVNSFLYGEKRIDNDLGKTVPNRKTRREMEVIALQKGMKTGNPRPNNSINKEKRNTDNLDEMKHILKDKSFMRAISNGKYVGTSILSKDITLSDDSIDMIYNMAITEFKAGKYNEATKLFLEYAKKIEILLNSKVDEQNRPLGRDSKMNLIHKLRNAFINLSITYCSNFKYNKAANAAKYAIDCDKFHWKGHFRRALALFCNGEHFNALSALNDSMETNSFKKEIITNDTQYAVNVLANHLKQVLIHYAQIERAMTQNDSMFMDKALKSMINHDRSQFDIGPQPDSSILNPLDHQTKELSEAQKFLIQQLRIENSIPFKSLYIHPYYSSMYIHLFIQYYINEYFSLLAHGKKFGYFDKSKLHASVMGKISTIDQNTHSIWVSRKVQSKAIYDEQIAHLEERLNSVIDYALSQNHKFGKGVYSILDPINVSILVPYLAHTENFDKIYELLLHLQQNNFGPNNSLLAILLNYVVPLITPENNPYLQRMYKQQENSQLDEAIVESPENDDATQTNVEDKKVKENEEEMLSFDFFSTQDIIAYMTQFQIPADFTHVLFVIEAEEMIKFPSENMLNIISLLHPSLDNRLLNTLIQRIRSPSRALALFNAIPSLSKKFPVELNIILMNALLQKFRVSNDTRFIQIYNSIPTRSLVANIVTFRIAHRYATETKNQHFKVEILNDLDKHGFELNELSSSSSKREYGREQRSFKKHSKITKTKIYISQKEDGSVDVKETFDGYKKGTRKYSKEEL